jgi:hypothetical protein
MFSTGSTGGWGELTGPEHASAYSPVVLPVCETPPGHFLTPELESDCARFLLEVKELAKRRAEAAAAEPARL